MKPLLLASPTMRDDAGYMKEQVDTYNNEQLTALLLWCQLVQIPAITY